MTETDYKRTLPLLLAGLSLLLYTQLILAQTFLDSAYDLALTSSNVNSHVTLEHSNPSIVYFDKHRFNLNTRQLSRSVITPNNNYTSKIFSDKLLISNWKDEYLPLLNNRPLPVNGKSLALSISEDDQHFVIATDTETVLFTRDGQRIWSHPETDSIISLLISPDKTLVISRNTRGVIRWQQFTSGRTLLSLYTTPDTEQWIIWSPAGYFDQSAPMFNPLNVYLSPGKQASLSQYDKLYFRPEVIQSLISNPDYVEPLIDRHKLVPPLVQLEGRLYDQVRLCIQQTQSDPVDAVIAVNNVSVYRGTAKTATSANKSCQQELSYTLSPHHAIQQVSAEVIDTKNKVSSNRIVEKLDFASITPDKREQLFITSSAGQSDLKPRFIPPVNLTGSLSHNDLSSTLSELAENLKKKSPEAFSMYLMAYCRVSDSGLFLLDKAQGKPVVDLQKLSRQLQSINSVNSLVLIDCIGEINNTSKDAIKRYAHAFIRDTGRSTVLLWSNLQTTSIRNSKSRTTMMQSVLQNGFTGEADLDDNLMITSEEIVNYLKTNLTLRSYELTGVEPILFTYHNQLTNYILPVSIND